MSAPKAHAAKTGNPAIAMCWNTKAEIITADEAQVTCKKCLKSIAFYREEAAYWEARKAREADRLKMAEEAAAAMRH